MDISYYLRQIAINGQLSCEEAGDLFDKFLTTKNDCTEPSQEFDSDLATAYLYSTALRTLRSEEFVGAARVLRRKMIAVSANQILGDVDLLDTCGTGGSGLNPFNTSTAVAFITAAAGVYTAKHGNRAASSQSGSADVLQALGINISASPERFLNCLAATKFGFLFAPNHHPAARQVAPLRKKLGVRTIFNFLGPILNPAGANLQLLGVSDSNMQTVMAEALVDLGTKHALVVRGEDGLDEITLSTRTYVCEVWGGHMTTYWIAPEDFGLERAPAKDTSGAPADEAAKMLRDVFRGVRSPRADLVVLNAGAALYVAERVKSVGDGVIMAREILDSGKAEDVLNSVISVMSS